MSGRGKGPDSFLALCFLTFLSINPFLNLLLQTSLSPQIITLFHLANTYTYYILDPEFSPEV